MREEIFLNWNERVRKVFESKVEENNNKRRKDGKPKTITIK